MSEFGTPKTQPEEGIRKERESEVFARLEELNKKEFLTAEDIEWFESGVIEKAFRSREESLYTDGEAIEEDSDESTERFNNLEVLHRDVTKKVARWKEDNAE